MNKKFKKKNRLDRHLNLLIYMYTCFRLTYFVDNIALSSSVRLNVWKISDCKMHRVKFINDKDSGHTLYLYRYIRTGFPSSTNTYEEDDFLA